MFSSGVLIDCIDYKNKWSAVKERRHLCTVTNGFIRLYGASVRTTDAYYKSLGVTIAIRQSNETADSKFDIIGNILILLLRKHMVDVIGNSFRDKKKQNVTYSTESINIIEKPVR